MSVTVGAIFRPQLPPDRVRSGVVAAEQAGLRELWLWEDCFLESGIATAAAALAWSDELVVGIGLLPTPLRNVALTAMEIATLERMFPGRLRIALGHGVQEWMGQAGVRAASPLTLMREYVTALRALLAGESVTVSGDYVNLTDVQLGWAPDVATPLLIGATGPRTLQLAGELGDGVVLDSVMSPARIVQALTDVDSGTATGRRRADFVSVLYLRAFLGDGAAEQLDRETAPAMAGGVRGHGVAGGLSEVVQEVLRCAAAGATSVILQPSAVDSDIEGYVDFAARVAREVSMTSEGRDGGLPPR
jgi:alkanesulfonate monooxygenase SsuD/methylene tetrahydromethanopterin reductase-like flavin-dependent oxidoreductase (luciferase family)